MTGREEQREMSEGVNRDTSYTWLGGEEGVRRKDIHDQRFTFMATWEY